MGTGCGTCRRGCQGPAVSRWHSRCEGAKARLGAPLALGQVECQGGGVGSRPPACRRPTPRHVTVRRAPQRLAHLVRRHAGRPGGACTPPLAVRGSGRWVALPEPARRLRDCSVSGELPRPGHWPVSGATLPFDRAAGRSGDRPRARRPMCPAVRRALSARPGVFGVGSRRLRGVTLSARTRPYFAIVANWTSGVVRIWSCADSTRPNG